MAEAELQQAWRYEPKKSDPEEVNISIFHQFSPDCCLSGLLLMLFAVYNNRCKSKT